MNLRYLVLFLFGFAGAGACSEPEGTGISSILAPAPDGELSFPVYDNFDAIAPLFEQRNDTTYVINFWATWCNPCVEELPHFTELAEKHADAPLRIVLVSLDFKKDITTKLPKFIQDRKLKLPVVALTDPQQAAWIDRVDPKWGGAIPVTVIYKNGLRFFVNEAFDTYQDLESMVSRIL